jgi:hypothetical protein
MDLAGAKVRIKSEKQRVKSEKIATAYVFFIFF